MTVQKAVHLLAGTLIVASLALAHWVSPYWLILTAFVGLNLFQSGFTNWCPAMSVFRLLGLKDQDTSCAK